MFSWDLWKKGELVFTGEVFLKDRNKNKNVGSIDVDSLTMSEIDDVVKKNEKPGERLIAACDTQHGYFRKKGEPKHKASFDF